MASLIIGLFVALFIGSLISIVVAVKYTVAIKNHISAVAGTPSIPANTDFVIHDSSSEIESRVKTDVLFHDDESLDTLKSIYEKINHFSNLMSVEIEAKSVVDMLAQLTDFATTINSHPVVLRRLQNAKELWGYFVNNPLGLPEIQHQHTLKFGPHLKHELEQCSIELGKSISSEEFQINFLRYTEILENWGKFNKSWLMLRGETEKGIKEITDDVIDSGDSEKLNSQEGFSKNWGWLKHPVLQNRFDLYTISGEKRTFSWSPWNILTSSERFEEVCMLVEKEIIDKQWNFKAVCALSTSGFPLALFIGKAFSKPVIGFDQESQTFFPPPPNLRGKILLVDFSVHTGSTLLKAITHLRKISEDYEGIITVCYNDYLEKYKSKEKIRIFDNRKIVHLFRMSDFNVLPPHHELDKTTL
ncbi:MAG: phosphoribosyltransferase [Candidatus Thiodiazotropha sp.]